MAPAAGPARLGRAAARRDRPQPAADAATRRSSANRQRWVDFVENDLGQALAQYDGATTVAQRQEALNRVHQALRSLQTGNQQRPWQPSWDLQAAVNDLFNQPNLDITADVNTSRRSSTRTS